MFSDEADAIKIANDTSTGLGAGVWTRDGSWPTGRPGESRPAGYGRTATTPTRSAFARSAGYKQSGVGRENHKMMLDHYQQTKNLLVSYSPKKLGFLLGLIVRAAGLPVP